MWVEAREEKTRRGQRSEQRELKAGITNRCYFAQLTKIKYTAPAGWYILLREANSPWITRHDLLLPQGLQF